MTNYTTVTELPGVGLTRHALEMVHTRYSMALPYCKERDVLEVACSAGQGLGMLTSVARRTVGGDITRSMVLAAARQYRGRVDLTCLDAQQLPFADGSFDVVLLYEALYYLQSVEQFVDECRRVLRPGGNLLICSINPAWPGLSRSPFSVRYYTARELADLLHRYSFSVDLFGAHPEAESSPFARAIGVARRTAARFHLIPGTMRGKQLLKRLAYGRLIPAAAELRAGTGPVAPLIPLSPRADSSRFRVIYAVGRLPVPVS